MNWLVGGMGRHGMLDTPLGAGQYPYPQPPFPLGYAAAPMMAMNDMHMPNMHGMGMGMMNGGNMPPQMPGYGMPFGGIPFMPNHAVFGPQMFGGSGGYDDDDDTGFWDGEQDSEGLPFFDAWFRDMRRQRKQRGKYLFPFPLPYATESLFCHSNRFRPPLVLPLWPFRFPWLGP